jgi:hypothetical protein
MCAKIKKNKNCEAKQPMISLPQNHLQTAIDIITRNIRCNDGLEVNETLTGCQDLNECDYHPCGPGFKCHNIDKGRGWYCECEQRSCTNCSCVWDIGMNSQTEVSVGIGALSIILACIIAYLGKFQCVFSIDSSIGSTT